MHRYTLNDSENAALEKWVNRPKVKKALKAGKLTLTFSETGIGMHIQADVMKDGQSLVTLDATDYGSW